MSYDQIGKDYAQHRRPDPRIAAMIDDAVGDVRSLLNIGAGSGSYEPARRRVAALEPSATMIAQRPAGSAPACQGAAENLPFGDDQFDAAMALLTVHHWTDLKRGLLEMQRVARQRLVIMTFDPASAYFWLADYIPEIVTLDQKIMPDMARYGEILGPVQIKAMAIPCDCSDGFLGAYWRRPAAYLDPRIRSAMSTFAKIADPSPGLARLEQDLASGRWQELYGDQLALDHLDIGYRLVIANL